MADDRTDHQPWPLRALLLLGIGALFGLIFDLLVSWGRTDAYFFAWTDDPVRYSLATWVAISGLLLAFTLERARWLWSAAFAAAGGAVLALVYYWNGGPDGSSSDEAWRFISGLLAVAIAAPLFQTMRDQGSRAIPYTSVHAHSWTNVVLWFAAWAFVLVTWLLTMLLAQLFKLIGIDLLADALDESWFNLMLICGSLGAVVGLLRDRDRVLGLLQRVVTTVLAFLAPILAAGLVLFVLALPFTGLAPLWDQTRATTPILLSCVIGAIILANAVIGNSAEEEAQAPPLRWSAIALAAVMLPLAIVAAVSTGLRIDQHGLTPARLWAVVFIAIAAAYGLLYLLALVLGRQRWSDRLRHHNLRLAFALCGVALVLATPLINFGALSTRDQLARLESGRIAPDRFDWAAMRFDFGPSGRRALERLKASAASAEVRRLADRALSVPNRWDLAMEQTSRRQSEEQRLTVLPAGAVVPPALRSQIGLAASCPAEMGCALILPAGGTMAILVQAHPCLPADHGLSPLNATAATAPRCSPLVRRFYPYGEEWNEGQRGVAGQLPEAQSRRFAAAVREGRVDIRPVTRRQVHIDGTPVGEAFD